jgi:hypothetical protein
LSLLRINKAILEIRCSTLPHGFNGHELLGRHLLLGVRPAFPIAALSAPEIAGFVVEREQHAVEAEDASTSWSGTSAYVETVFQEIRQFTVKHNPRGVARVSSSCIRLPYDDDASFPN